MRFIGNVVRGLAIFIFYSGLALSMIAGIIFALGGVVFAILFAADIINLIEFDMITFMSYLRSLGLFLLGAAVILGSAQLVIQICDKALEIRTSTECETEEIVASENTGTLEQPSEMAQVLDTVNALKLEVKAQSKQISSFEKENKKLSKEVKRMKWRR